MSFLDDWDDCLPWQASVGTISATEVLRGDENTGLVVVSGRSDEVPTRGDLRTLWNNRAGHSALPVLLAILYPSEGEDVVVLFGPSADANPVYAIELGVAEQLLKNALKQRSPSGLSAELTRRLSVLAGGANRGFRNEGLFASHVLDIQPSRIGWRELCESSLATASQRGVTLLGSLGYTVEVGTDIAVLSDPATKTIRAAAVLLSENESFENPLPRFNGSNAAAHGLAIARAKGIDWLIVVGASTLRLYPSAPQVGIGRKGQTQTFLEVDLLLLTRSTSGYLELVFSSSAVAAGGTVDQLLADSAKFATGLSERLRDRIYEDVMTLLAPAIARHRNVAVAAAREQRSALDEAYHQAMIVLFRLLFVAYAEDRGLLPLDVNETYTSNALKTLGRRILADPDQVFSSTSTSIWADLVQVWDVVDSGDIEGMGVPAYNGGLFTRDATKNALGAGLYDLHLRNDEIGPVLAGLLIDVNRDGVLGLVDFRSLDVREFGTIYEGLLESGLAVASLNLTLDANET